jgi:hypothetical protein
MFHMQREDYYPQVSYKKGGWYYSERVEGENGKPEYVDRPITLFRAEADIKNIGLGLRLIREGQRPQMKLVPADAPAPYCPDKDWKQIVRLFLILEGENFVRELCSPARGVWNALDLVHTIVCEEAPNHPKENSIIESVSAVGANHQPDIKLVGWKPRSLLLPDRPPASILDPEFAALWKPGGSGSSGGNGRKPPKEDMDDEIPFELRG